MDIGQVVSLVEDVAGVATKVPALVVRLYENAHNEVVADLHKLAVTHTAVISADDNPPEAVAPGSPSVTADLTPPAAAPTAQTPAERIAELEAQLAAKNDVPGQSDAERIAELEAELAAGGTAADGGPTT